LIGLFAERCLSAHSQPIQPAAAITHISGNVGFQDDDVAEARRLVAQGSVRALQFDCLRDNTLKA